MTGTEISRRTEEQLLSASKVPVAAWTVAILAFGALLLTELVVDSGAGGLVIDWKIGPAFLGLVGSIWGARRARRRLLFEEAEDARIAEEEEIELLEMARTPLPRPEAPQLLERAPLRDPQRTED